MNDHQHLVALLADRSARRGQFTLASGRVSTLYIDARMTTMSPDGLALIGRLGLAEIAAAGWTPDAVGGLTLGGGVGNLTRTLGLTIDSHRQFATLTNAENITPEVVEGKRVAAGVRFIVTPASQLVYREAIRSGALGKLAEAGAMIAMSAMATIITGLPCCTKSASRQSPSRAG